MEMTPAPLRVSKSEVTAPSKTTQRQNFNSTEHYRDVGNIDIDALVEGVQELNADPVTFLAQIANNTSVPADTEHLYSEAQTRNPPALTALSGSPQDPNADQQMETVTRLTPELYDSVLRLITTTCPRTDTELASVFDESKTQARNILGAPRDPGAGMYSERQVGSIATLDELVSCPTHALITSSAVEYLADLGQDRSDRDCIPESEKPW